MAGENRLRQILSWLQRAANVLLLAVVLIWLGLRSFRSDMLAGWLAQATPDYPFLANMGTAVGGNGRSLFAARHHVCPQPNHLQKPPER
ncbi:MAG: hypothetical protein IPM39_20475 [Chloroflexi bacterium]|nr:hypothetical protein [Chloroflexota bacterium]